MVFKATLTETLVSSGCIWSMFNCWPNWAIFCGSYRMTENWKVVSHVLCVIIICRFGGLLDMHIMQDISFKQQWNLVNKGTQHKTAQIHCHDSQLFVSCSLLCLTKLSGIHCTVGPKCCKNTIHLMMKKIFCEVRVSKNIPFHTWLIPPTFSSLFLKGEEKRESKKSCRKNI